MRNGSAPDTPRRTALAAAAVVALVAAVHGGSLGHGWVFDDPRFIVNNPHVTSPASWTAFLTDMRTTDPLSPAGIVRPLRTLSFALDAQVFGLSPAAFHAHTLAWFAAGAVMLLLLLRDLVRDLRAATFGAAAWAVHPMQVEVSSWVSSRGDAACGALVLAAAWAALRPGRRWTVASVALALLAAGFKEVGVVAPLMVVLARTVRPPGGVREGLLRTTLRAWPWFAASAVYVAYRGAVQIGATSHVQTYVLGGSAAGTFATMFRAFGVYVAAALVPVRPAVDWFLPAVTSLAAPSALAWLAIHGALLVAGFRGLRTRPALGAGILWFYAALLPVANWPFFLGIPTTERFLHPALAGAALAGAAAFAAAPRRAWIPAALGVACLGVGAARRVPVWRDDTTLWPATAAAVRSPRAEAYLAAELRKEGFALLASKDAAARGRLEEGLRHAHRAVALWAEIEGTWRSRTHVVAEPHVNAANLCFLLGRHGEALFHSDAAIAIGEDLSPQAHYNRAFALLSLGRGAAAAAAMVRATEIGLAPDAEVRDFLERAARLCDRDGETEPARRALAAAAAVPAPGGEPYRRALADLDARTEETTDRLRQSLLRDPAGAPRWNAALAVHLAATGAVADADEIVARLGRSGARTLDVAGPDWVRARWAARGSREGWSKAADLLAATRDPDGMFLRARALEELGRDAEAAEAFVAFLARMGPDPPPEDGRIARARAAADRLAAPCPEFPPEPPASR